MTNCKTYIWIRQTILAKPNICRQTTSLIWTNNSNTFDEENVFYTIGLRFVEKDASHFIYGVQDVLRVVDAQETRFCGFVISCQSAPAFLSFLVTLFHAPYFRDLLQSCVAGSHTLFLCKQCRHTFNVCVTQRNDQKQNKWRFYKIKTFKRETHANVEQILRALSSFRLENSYANDRQNVCVSSVIIC